MASSHLSAAAETLPRTAMFFVAGSRVEECRERETAHLFGEPLLHRISVFSSNNNVFPVGMLARLREFVVRKHQQQDRLASSPVPVVLEEILANFDESWALPAAATGTGSGEDAGRPSCPRVLRQRLLPDFEYMGAFLWHEMHEEVHWLPTDPRDLEPDGWTVDDYFRFSWTCRALHPPSPDGDGDVDGDIMQQFMAELENVNSALSCWRFNDRWTSP